MLYVDKYAPKGLDEVIGNPDAVAQITRWANAWQLGRRQRPLLLSGPPGTGKTAAAHALGSQMKWEILEMNASDLRNKASIERILVNASETETLHGHEKTDAPGVRPPLRKLLIIDEADSLFSADRGGSGAIAKLLDSARQPLILIANDAWARSLSSARQKCTAIKFHRISARSVESHLKKIAEKEKIKINESILATIAERSRGDLRSALNDLQSLAHSAASAEPAWRDREQDVFGALAAILKATDYSSARRASMGVDVDHDMFMRWVEENIPREYTDKADLAAAFETLSRASLFDARARRTQNYTFWRYSGDLSTAGVAMAKTKQYNSYVGYQFPSIVRAYSSSKAARAMRSSIARKLAHACHTTTKKAASALWLLQLLMEDKKFESRATEQLGLNEEETNFLSASEAKNKKSAKNY